MGQPAKGRALAWSAGRGLKKLSGPAAWRAAGPEARASLWPPSVRREALLPPAVSQCSKGGAFEKTLQWRQKRCLQPRSRRGSRQKEHGRSSASKLAHVGGEPRPRVVNSISRRDQASKNALTATVLGEGTRGLLGCRRVESPGVAGMLAASSRPRLPYSGVSLVPAGPSGLAPSSGFGRLLCMSVRAGP